MANTFELIASSTVGAGGASNITFNSIPSTYTDLQLVYSIRGVASYTAGYAVFYVNNDTSSTYSAIWLIGDGSTAASTNAGSGTTVYQKIVGGNQQANATSNTFSNGCVYLPNYNSSNNKVWSGDGVGENNATLAFSIMSANIITNTAAVNSVTIANYDAGGLAQYSTAYLYGIKNS